jgi:hypothetical protein
VDTCAGCVKQSDSLEAEARSQHADIIHFATIGIPLASLGRQKEVSVETRTRRKALISLLGCGCDPLTLCGGDRHILTVADWLTTQFQVSMP